MSGIEIERLSAHHLWGSFDAGPRAGKQNELLRQYAQAYENGDPEPAIVFCAIEKPSEEVLGYIALEETRQGNALYLRICSIAVAHKVHTTEVFLKLARKAHSIALRTNSTGDPKYAGVVARADGSVTGSALRTLGFRKATRESADYLVLRNVVNGFDGHFFTRRLPVRTNQRMATTFISYGGLDEAFARRLYNYLTAAGVRCYFFPESATYGERLHKEIYRNLQKHDRIILICSKTSLTRRGVLQEIQETLAREAKDGGATYLLPIMLDNYVLSAWRLVQPELAEQVGRRVIGDFRTADRNPDDFKRAMSRLLAALHHDYTKGI